MKLNLTKTEELELLIAVDEWVEVCQELVRDRDEDVRQHAENARALEVILSVQAKLNPRRRRRVK